MKIHITESAVELGEAAAKHTADILNEAIRHSGSARLILSTGMSQFETISSLLKQEVDWSRVEAFHLDEYIGLPVSHPASFRKYLTERFTDKIRLKAFHPVDGEGDTAAVIRKLNSLVAALPVDVGLIGIGENAHIAFNDPPADFGNDSPYIVVTLDEKCRAQQVREGWFPDLASVPEKAVSMSVRQIIRCRNIISSVPHAVKAQAVRMTLESHVSESVPASILKTHPAFHLYLDMNSASQIDMKKWLC